jgi:hypothetical protein
MTAEILAAAAKALDTDLTAGPTLGGSTRSLVLRATAGPHRYVLKAPLESGAGPVRERAALTVLRGLPGVPDLLATADDPPVLVLADLGDGRSVADTLLGPDPAAAETALAGWATALGILQAASADRHDAFAAELAALSPLGPPPADGSADALAGAAGTLARHLPRLGVTPPAAALDELSALLPAGPAALTPGDTCPDNNVRTADGYVLIDFEAAEFRPLAWEAAYLRVPWPSCWCSWTVPAEVAERTLARWRAAVGPLPAGFDAEIDRATLAWTFISTGWFLPRILAGDDAPEDRPTPTRRALLQHRLGQVTAPGPLGELAAGTAAALRRAYGDHPLLPAPAFR